MRTLLSVLAAALLGVACATPSRPADRLRRVDLRRVEAVGDSLAKAASGAERQAVFVHALAASGLTPLAAGSFTTGLAPGIVGGLVPGRQPVARPTLVVVGTSAEDPAAPLVLEAARLLVVRSLYETVPERTVLVAFWDGGAAPRGVEAVLQTPLWPRDRIAGAVVVGEEREGVSDVPVVSLPVEAGDRGAEVLRLVAAFVEAAQVPAPPDTLPDTLAAR